jgi:hypothetical protein
MKSTNRLFLRPGLVLCIFAWLFSVQCKVAETAQPNDGNRGPSMAKASVNGSPSTQTELGFYPIGSPQIPPAVQEASQRAVFKIVLPMSSLAQLDLTKKSEEEVIAVFQHNDKEFKPLWKESYVFQIKQCFAAKLSSCPVLFDFSSGSGFLIRDKQGAVVLASAMHLLKPFLRATLSAQLSSQPSASVSDLIKYKRIPVELYDEDSS